MKILKLGILILSIFVVSCKPAKYTDLSDGLYADLETNKGTILLKLEFEIAPVTVANFVSLADGTNEFVADSLKGVPFYDGTIFHRVIPNFMIQGGDRSATGLGDPGYKFDDEFPIDEQGELLLKHDGPGVLSMANGGPNANGSQFFITHKDTPWLNGKHSIFGKVEKGQAVVDSIVKNDTIKTIEIIRVGRAAKSFNAVKVFSEYFKKQAADQLKKEQILQIAAETSVKKFNKNLPEATELPSGLKILITETKNGVKPKNGEKVKVYYAGYFTDGRLFGTNFRDVAKIYGTYDEAADNHQNAYNPFTTEYGPEARLIPGFKEGLQKMKYGDKAMLFIPSHLGYGAQGAGADIPPNSDLVFELELVKIDE